MKKLLMTVFLWLIISVTLVACAMTPSETEAPDGNPGTAASESETQPESRPDETQTGSEEKRRLDEEGVKIIYDNLGITVHEIRRVGGRFLVWADSLDFVEGYEPDSVFEIVDPLTGERIYLLETDGPAVDIDVRTHEDGTIFLRVLQEDYYGDRMRGRNGQIAVAVERVTPNGPRAVDRSTEFFLYPLGCPFTVGSVLEEKSLNEVELKNVRISTDGTPYLYLAFGWRGKDGESGPIPVAEVSGEEGVVRVFFPGISLSDVLAGEHEVRTKEDYVFLTSWKAETTAEGVLLTVTTGETITCIACHVIGVRDGSEMCLQLENPGNSYPTFMYQGR